MLVINWDYFSGCDGTRDVTHHHRERGEKRGKAELRKVRGRTSGSRSEGTLEIETGPDGSNQYWQLLRLSKQERSASPWPIEEAIA